MIPNVLRDLLISRNQLANHRMTGKAEF